VVRIGGLSLDTERSAALVCIRILELSLSSAPTEVMAFRGICRCDDGLEHAGHAKIQGFHIELAPMNSCWMYQALAPEAQIACEE
jgi:hypothetical protein